MLGHFVAYNFINAVLKLVFQIHVMLFCCPSLQYRNIMPHILQAPEVFHQMLVSQLQLTSVLDVARLNSALDDLQLSQPD